MTIHDKAREEGVSLSELGRRGGLKSGRIRREAAREKVRKKRLVERAEEVRASGRDYWND